ncbi:sulfotransferase 1 [Mactra antiquata]
MHTSSSYTASVINQYPESVMYGEPLEHIAHMIASSSSLYMLNGTITQPLYANNLQSYGIRYLTNLFLCQLWNIDVLTLWKYNSKHISTLWQCPSTPDISVVKRGKLAADFNDVTNGLKSCSPKLVSLCNGASLRATKTIRMSMSMVRDVFAAFKNLKIIHLLRDPRAMIDSNVRRHEIGVDVNIDKFKRRAREICKLMLNDLRESSILKMSYPGQILTARYEDMVDDPILSAKRMYEFLDIPFTRSVRKYVQQKNSNSGTRSALWRTHISKEHLEIVNQHCSELYKELGYPKFDTLDEVRNLDITGYTSIGHE